MCLLTGCVMGSYFAWLDFSEKERRDALEVIDLFKEEDTRDELGLGVVRDAFSDLLFPGTNTIQTRARYFLFIPWLFTRMETRAYVSPLERTRQARFQQNRLRDSLVKGGEENGVIGYRAGLESIGIISSGEDVGLRYDVLRKLKARGEFVSVEIEASEKEIADTMQKLRLVWRAIESGIIYRNPGYMCSGCQWANNCAEEQLP